MVSFEPALRLSIPALTLVDTTLREGEQVRRAYFSSEQRLALAGIRDAFGVDVIEVPSPRLSPQTERDVRAIARLDLRARIAAHVRCVGEDVEAALASGMATLHLFFGASPHPRAYSHGRGVAQIAASAVRQVRRICAAGAFARFSAEDAFRTSRDDLVRIFDPVVAAGAECLGLPDTVGVAAPWQVAECVVFFRARYPTVSIEFHGHNDTGCAVANALAALEAGADRIDVTVLGIGERNGIASLSGVVAARCPRRPELLSPYDLTRLPALDRFVAGLMEIPIPFNSPITGEFAFTHRAGIHTNAVLRAQATYETLDPAGFGLTRSIDSTSRMVGRHAREARAAALRLTLEGEQAWRALAEVKRLADAGSLEQSRVDDVIRRPAGGQVATGTPPATRRWARAAQRED